MKRTQADVRYRPGDPSRLCGICEHYHYNSCEKVTGHIDPYGYCDIYEERNNPFGIRYDMVEGQLKRRP